MKMQTIVEKIISDAEKYAAEIIENAEQQAYEILSTAELLAGDNYEKAESGFESAKAGVIESRKTAANIQSKNIKAGKRSASLDECFVSALEKLIKMPDSDYKKLVFELLEKYAEEGDRVIVSEFDREILNREFFNEYNQKHAAKIVFNGNYDKSFKKGFILSNSRCDKNLTFDAHIKRMRDNWFESILV